MSAEKECLVVKDMYTGITHAYPMSGRNSSLVMESIKFFTGRRRIQLAYSDSAPELIKAMRSLNILHDTATPGVPKTNASAAIVIGIVFGKSRFMAHVFHSDAKLSSNQVIRENLEKG